MRFLLLSFVLLIVACSSGTETSPETETPTKSQVASQTETPSKVETSSEGEEQIPTQTQASTQGEGYQIIKIAGNISHCNEGQKLRTQDRLNADDLLCFANTGSQVAVAAVIDLKSKKRFTLKSTNPTAGTQQGKVRDCLVGSRSMAGTRQGKLNNILDIRTLLGKGDFLILGGSLRMEINPAGLPMNDKSFFFASFPYKGETINKKLSHSGNQLILSRSELFKVDGKSISSSQAGAVSLYYFQTQENSRKLITTFQPSFPSDAEIIQELDVIRQANAGASKEAMQKDMLAYLFEVYDKADPDNLNAWLKKYLS